MITHRLLQRQIRKYLGEHYATTPGLMRLLQVVNDTYEQHDVDRKLLQRSMELSSEELMAANDKLLRASEQRALVLQRLKDSIRALNLGAFEEELSDEDVLSLADVLAEQIALRNEAQALLQEREERLRLIIESAKDYAIYTLDPEGLITSWNAGAQRISGFSADEVIGRHFALTFTEADRAHGLDAEVYATTVRSGRCELQGWHLRKDGPPFWADTTMTALRGADGALQGFVKITRDITERRQAEEALRQAKEVAEAANQAKMEFLANMSHEIRTPMNAVIGMTSLLLDTPLDHEQHDCVETIRASGEALLTLINDILDFSKVEAGKLTLEAQPFELYACIEEALDLFATKAARKGVELVYDVAPEVPETLVGDVTRLRQVLVNLVSNAVKFTEQGEVVVTATGRPEGTDFRLQVAVRDTGVGIPQDRMHRLFKSFSQLDASNTRKYGGTGLGLAISRRLVELMGGTIWVERAPSAGAAFHFTITLPVLASGEQPAPSVGAGRVLVVDAHPVRGRMIGRLLDQWGMAPQLVTSAGAARAHLDKAAPADLLLVDLQMPGLEGLAFLADVRRRSEAPVLLLTSLGDARAREQADLPPGVVFLFKPVKQVQLYNAVRGLFNAEPVPAPAARFDRHMAEKLPVRILLAEDSFVNQKVVLRILERLGYRADAVANGQEVVQALLRCPYDVVLMDVQMPEMDGLEATREIRRRLPAERQPYIIALTASARAEDRRTCLAAGMNHYISKPVRLEALIAALEAVRVSGVQEPGSGY